MNVCIWPSLQELAGDNGIGKVVEAQFHYLPSYGITLTGPEQAEVIAVHTQQAMMPRVDVLHTHGMYWTGEPKSGNYSLQWYNSANQKIIEAARKARVITVPSNWVAMPFKRDMRISPVVI